MIQILLADDHVLFREGLKQILAKHNDMYVVREAGTGQEVLSIIRDQDLDLLLLDISMPGRSGLDILSDVRREKPDLPVLVLSMYPEDQYAIRVFRAGASGYITKESTGSELIEAIRKVANGGKHVGSALAEKLAVAIEHDSAEPEHQKLSNREFQVMCMLVNGKTLKEIAAELLLSEKTVTTYRARILEKLEVRNNVELTHYAIETGFHVHDIRE